jgi:hypothetical protein
MSPTLRDGDVVVVRHGVPPRAGAIVLARYRSMPDRPVLKRVLRRLDDGWELASDNPGAGGGSDVHGVADVDATVVLRLRRGALPRRV